MPVKIVGSGVCTEWRFDDDDDDGGNDCSVTFGAGQGIALS